MQNNESQLILSGLSTADFIQSLTEQVRVIIKEEMCTVGKLQDERLISPAETCKLFNPPISKVTLTAWTKQGYLQDHRIGGRIYYKQTEVIESAKTLKKYQTK